MTQDRGSTRGGWSTGALLAGAVGLLALPSAVLAFTVNFDRGLTGGQDDDGVGVMDGVDEGSALARNFPARSLARGKLYPFTPAESPNRPDRSVTVAVRVDPATARTLTVLAPRLAIERPEVRIAPTAFSLGVSRGYTNFAQNLVRKDDSPNGVAPDLGRYSIANGGVDDSRFSPRIVMDETQSAGRAPRTFAGDADDLVDLGGSYRLSKNLNVTAGVRYSQERERIVPVTDGKQDSQAVYVGTQFRF